MNRSLMIPAIAMAAVACGHEPQRLGILVDRVAYARTNAGTAPADIATQGFLSSSYRRIVNGDVVGDEALERIVERADHHGVDVQNAAGAVIETLKTEDYLTDFHVARRGAEKLLVLYTYPNAQGGGTFLVMSAERGETARWTENPPVGHFTTGVWKDTPAVFYLRGDTLVVRTLDGGLLATLVAPNGHIFRDVFVGPTFASRTILVASGSGYTPYHMVCVYSDTGDLVFQDIEQEHAFQLFSDAHVPSFGVVTRSARWRYSPATEATR